MKKVLLLMTFASIGIYGQNLRITYKNFYNNKEQQRQDPIVVLSSPEATHILSQATIDGTKPMPYEVETFNRKEDKVLRFAFLKDNEVAEMSRQGLGNHTFELKDETKKILGYTCKKAVTSINSNTIELWYVPNAKVDGSPSMLGQNLGLVLEIVRNGNTATRAVEVKKTKQMEIANLFASKKVSQVDGLTYDHLLWKSRFTTLPIFSEEQINFVKEPKKDEQILRFANGTVILKKVKFPKVNKEDNVFVELVEQSLGDAYDRTGTVFLIPQNKELSFFDALSKGIDSVPFYDNGDGKQYKAMVGTEKFEPMIELMRFFTPFGIKQFNYLQRKDKEWHDKVHYRQDISELRPEYSDREVWIGTFIGNYDKGGHKVSLEITIHRNGLDVFNNNVAIPLFNTLNAMEMAGQTYPTLFGNEKGLTMTFTLKKDLKNAQLRYISTGHGGWGQGDEFVPKENRISLNGKQIFAFTPWRTECGSYRLYNPASGNFSNGLSSSDYSRSNWCPGTVTNPIYIPMGDLNAGTHTLQISIPQGKPEGNNLSFWSVSGVLLGKE